MNRALLTLSLLLAATAIAGPLPTSSPAQDIEFPAASPACTLKQRIGITDVEITYARPSAKGRKVFGELVPLGAVWRTGANSATTITFSTDVKLGGAAVPAGTYALFTIPGASEWTVILNKATEQWGSYGYDAKQDLVRVKAKPESLTQPLETLEIGLNDLRDGSATLAIAWEKVRVPVKLEIDTKGLLVPQIQAVMANSAEKPYFAAAMFYYENNLDLKQALAWIDAGIAASPEAFWMIYRKGLILEKSGDKAGAAAAARQSLELAKKGQGEIKDEYVRLNEALIKRTEAGPSGK